MSTIKEVADLAGVSIAAVSHVVNGTKRLSPQTTERIMSAIRQANYKPNTLAKSLRSGQTHTVGVLVEDIRGLPVPGVVCGISETLSEKGYQMLLYDLHLLERLYNQYEQIVEYRSQVNEGVQALLQACADGIIYVGMHDRFLDDIFNPIDRPMVFAYSHGTQSDTYVTYSNYDSSLELVNRLIALGHRRIAIITGHPHSYPSMKRLNAFKKAMSDAGLPVPDEYVKTGDWEYESGLKRTMELLRLPEPPTAIFALNDLMAAGCIHALLDAGLKVPEDVSVAGFDNREIAQYLQPPLTTVALPTAEIGRRAAACILERIDNAELPPSRNIIPCRIIDRQSVASAPAKG